MSSEGTCRLGQMLWENLSEPEEDDGLGAVALQGTRSSSGFLGAAADTEPSAREKLPS